MIIVFHITQPSSQLIDKSMTLSGTHASLWSLPLNSTHSVQMAGTLNVTLSRTRASISPTNAGKSACSVQPTPSKVVTNITGKNKSEAESSPGEMPSVVKVVAVASLMAFAGGYSAGYGPGKSAINPNDDVIKGVGSNILCDCASFCYYI